MRKRNSKEVREHTLYLTEEERRNLSNTIEQLQQVVRDIEMDFVSQGFLIFPNVDKKDKLTFLTCDFDVSQFRNNER